MLPAVLAAEEMLAGGQGLSCRSMNCLAFVNLENLTLDRTNNSDSGHHNGFIHQISMGFAEAFSVWKSIKGMYSKPEACRFESHAPVWKWNALCDGWN